MVVYSRTTRKHCKIERKIYEERANIFSTFANAAQRKRRKQKFGEAANVTVTFGE